MSVRRSLSATVGYAGLRMGIAPPKARFLERYREQWRMKSLLDRLRITTLLDVGANDGKFAERLRLIGYTGRIVSFEPIPSACEELRARAARFSGWNAYELALGSAKGTAKFNIIEKGGATVYSSFLSAAEIGEVPPVTRSQEVRIERLDALWSEIIRPEDRVFLKIDTQGFDMEVLKGTGEYLSQVLGIQTEMSVIAIYHGAPHYLESLQFLESKGFRLIELRPIDYDRRGAILEFDCFMARLEAMQEQRAPKA